MTFRRCYASINIPSITLNGVEKLYFYCNKFTYDGVTYSLNDFTDKKGGYIRVAINKITEGSNVYLSASMEYGYYDVNNQVQHGYYFQYVNPVGKSLQCDSACVTIDNTVDASFEQYITVLNSADIQFNIQNATVISYPNPLQYQMGGSEAWRLNPVIKIRANDGYTFRNATYTITCNGVSFSNYISLSDDGKEITFDNYENEGLGYLLIYPTLPFIVNAVAVQSTNYNITNNLTNCSNNNPSTSILDGSRYQATITPIQDYHIDSITITMGGIDITSMVYNEGVIDIPSVTGDIVITAVGKGNPTITYSLTGCTSSNTSTEVEYKSSYVTTITPNIGYSLEDMDVLITMGGVEQFNVYSNGVINIPEVTGDVVIILTATLIKTFNFKSMDGLTNFLTVNLVKISTLLFTIEGNTRRLTINGVNYTWVDAIPNEKQLIGLSLTANSNRYVIPLDVEVVVNYTQDTTFYEVIIDRQEQADTFSMILYKNNTQNERVDKTSYLQYKGTLNGTLRSSASVLNPQITIEWNGVVDFNYVYIPIFNRYYFVTDVIYSNKSLVVINLRVDVLMSHKDAIYQQNALIGRNEYQFNEYLVDEQRLVRDDVIVEFIRQEGSDFFNPDRATNNIIVNVIGGQE